MPSRRQGTGICSDTFELAVSVSVIPAIIVLIDAQGFGFVDDEAEDDVIQLLVHVHLPSLDSFQSSFQVLEYPDVLCQCLFAVHEWWEYSLLYKSYDWIALKGGDASFAGGLNRFRSSRCNTKSRAYCDHSETNSWDL